MAACASVGTATRISRSVTAAGVVNSVEVRVVVPARLVLGDRDLSEHLDLLDPLHEHRALELPAQIGHRHVLLLERRLELLVGVELVFLLDVVDDLLELLVRQLVAELFARCTSSISATASTMICGVICSGLAQLFVVLFALDRFAAALAERRNLARSRGRSW